MMSGSDFYTYVLAILKRTDKSTEVFQAITDTIRDMRLRFNSENFKTISTALTIGTIGNYSVAMPTDFGHLIGGVMVKETVADRDYPPLNKLSIGAFNEKYSSRFNTSSGNRLTGNPVDFCVFGGNLLIGPPVDKTTYEFRIAYTQEDGVEINSATSDVPFSDRYRKTLRYGVIKEVYVGLENYEEANIWSSLYEADLGKIADNDYKNSKGEEPLVYNGI